MAAMAATVLLLFPLHLRAWGLAIAAAHAFNGVALGWLLVEIACASVERPLVWTVPPSDGLNTVGVVLLGVLVISVCVLAAIEREALTGAVGSIAFPLVMVLAAACVRLVNERNHREAALPPKLGRRMNQLSEGTAPLELPDASLVGGPLDSALRGSTRHSASPPCCKRLGGQRRIRAAAPLSHP